eukprot:scaffold36624_cov62-Phaeocystis_antarctica.AAC.5
MSRRGHASSRSCSPRQATHSRCARQPLASWCRALCLRSASSRARSPRPNARSGARGRTFPRRRATAAANGSLPPWRTRRTWRSSSGCPRAGTPSPHAGCPWPRPQARRLGRVRVGAVGGLNLEGELADGAIDRVAHHAKGLLPPAIDGAALAMCPVDSRRDVPRGAGLPRVGLAKGCLGWELAVVVPLGLVCTPADTVRVGHVLQRRAARLGDVDHLERGVQRRHLPPPCGEIVPLDAQAGVLRVLRCREHVQALARGGRRGVATDVKVHVLHLTGGPHAHIADGGDSDVHPSEAELPGAEQMVAELGLRAKGEVGVRLVHLVELSKGREGVRP